MSSIRCFMKWTAIMCATVALFLGCGGEYRAGWGEVKLPSGRLVKVTACHLAWGVEHDERTPGNDSFDMEFVYDSPDANDDMRNREAKEAFELIRPIAEQWAVNN